MLEIDLTHTEDCQPGRYVTQMKTSRADKNFMADAAKLAGLPFSTFMRTVLFQAACQIHGRMPLEPTQQEDVAHPDAA